MNILDIIYAHFVPRSIIPADCHSTQCTFDLFIVLRVLIFPLKYYMLCFSGQEIIMFDVL